MIIYDFLYIGNLDHMIVNGKHQAVTLLQVQCILSFSIAHKTMAAANMELDHFFDSISCRQFINPLVDFSCHSFSIFLTGNIGIGTNFTEFSIFVLDFHRFTSFTYQVNSSIS